MIYNDFLDTYELRKYANAMNARARTYRARGVLTDILLRSLILDSAGKCAWCGQSLLKQEFEIDHIQPLRWSGTNTYDNLAVTCISCNRRKAEKSAIKFALELAAEQRETTLLVRKILDDHQSEGHHQPSLFD